MVATKFIGKAELTGKVSFKIDSDKDFRKTSQLLVTRPEIKLPVALPNPTGEIQKAEKSIRLQRTEHTTVP